MQTVEQQNTQPIQTQDVQQTETQQLQQIQVIFDPTQKDANQMNIQNMQMNQQDQEALAKQMLQELKNEILNAAGLLQEKSTCQKICTAIFSVILKVSVQIVFGVLLWVFQDQGEKNDYCDNDVLKKWAKATAIMLFVSSGIQTISIIDDTFLRPPLETRGKYYYLTNPLQIFIAIGLFAACIGLTVNNSSDCGQFYKLVLAYYIIYYILLGIGLLFSIFFACSFFKATR